MQKNEVFTLPKSGQSQLIAENESTAAVPDIFIPQADLPDEIALSILGYLSLIDLYQAMRVNKTWHRLSKDNQLWQSIINQYTKGHLWSYLFCQPGVKIYQNYFEEVFDEEGITFGNLDAIIQTTKARFAFSVYRDKIYRDIRKSFFDYLHEAEFSKRLQMTAGQAQSLPSQLRTDFLSAQSNLARCPQVVENIHQLIPTLRFINQLDIFLTEFIFVRKLVFNKMYKFEFDWLLNSQWNKLLTPRTIIALSSYAGNSMLQYLLSAPTFLPLLKNFTQQEVMVCASFPNMEREVLENHVFLNKLTVENIGDILDKLSIQDQTFTWLLQKNSVFIERLNSEFLMKLAKRVKGIALPILAHPKSLHRLSKEQCLKLKKRINKDITKLLYSETLTTSKTHNISPLLLKYKYLASILSYQCVASQISVTEVLKIACSQLVVAEALTRQPILLNQLNSAQLVKLACFHSYIALLLFKDGSLDSKWGFSDLEEVKKHHEMSRIFPQIKESANAIFYKSFFPKRSQTIIKFKEKSEHHAQQNFTSAKVFLRRNQSIPQATGRRKLSVPQNLKQMRIVRGTHRLEFQPLSSPVPLKRPDPPIAKNPVFRRRPHKKPPLTPAQILGTSLLTLLGIASVALLFSGVGAFMGAGFIISALLMVNLKMSIVTMGSLLMISGITTGIISVYSLSSMVGDEPLFPQANLAQPPAPNPSREVKAIYPPANLRPALQPKVKKASEAPEPIYGSPLHNSLPKKQVDGGRKRANSLQIEGLTA